MDDQDWYLEEYRLLVDIIKNVFNEFWVGNAFFTSVFSGLAAAELAAADKISALSGWTIAFAAAGVINLAAVWVLTNVRHRQVWKLHMEHARELEDKHLRCSIYTRRQAAGRANRGMSAGKLWIAAPVVFAAFDLFILSSLAETPPAVGPAPQDSFVCQKTLPAPAPPAALTPTALIPVVPSHATSETRPALGPNPTDGIGYTPLTKTPEAEGD